MKKQKKIVIWCIGSIAVIILLTTTTVIIPICLSDLQKKKKSLCHTNMFTIANRIKQYQANHGGDLPPDFLSMGIQMQRILKCPQKRDKTMNQLKISDANEWSEYYFTPTVPIEVKIDKQNVKIICFCSESLKGEGTVNLIKIDSNNNVLAIRPIIDKENRKKLKRIWENRNLKKTE